ncbi:MAG: DEAD/DEAH box helicase [Bacilli bacterium]|nr:DEAD/DEAH box helicase [Bacilli bacterium]
MSSFKSYALSNKMIETIEKLGYTEPTKVQEATIPLLLKEQSLVVRSETGSGKTHSFLIPILDKIDFSKKKVQAVIISSTRELASQTYDFIREFSPYYKELNVKLLVAGEDKKRLMEKLQNTPQIVVATPGRLNDLSLNEGVIDFFTLKYLVLDEADMLMDMGFFGEIDAFLSKTVNPCISVFSATIPQKLNGIIDRYIKADKIIEIDKEHRTSSRVKHIIVDTKHKDLKQCALSFIKQFNPYLLMIFASNKKTVVEVYKYLIENGIKAGLIHGDLEMRQRKQMMKRIKNDEFPVIVCSDMAARGLDLDHVSDILNIDLPNDFDFYFHRAGRAGRFDAYGNCYSFYDNDSIDKVRKIVDSINNVEYMQYSNGEFIEGKPLEKQKKSKNKINEDLEKEIKKAVSNTRTKEIKPGYKKKVKEAVAKAKQQYKRKIIKEDIRKQRVERYKQEAKERRGR